MTRQEMIDSLKCQECDMSTHHKMDCSSKNVFDAFKKALIWLPYMTNEQIAQLSFESWHIAYGRSGEIIEQDVEKAIDNIKKEELILSPLDEGFVVPILKENNNENN